MMRNLARIIWAVLGIAAIFASQGVVLVDLPAHTALAEKDVANDVAAPPSDPLEEIAAYPSPSFNCALQTVGGLVIQDIPDPSTLDWTDDFLGLDATYVQWDGIPPANPPFDLKPGDQVEFIVVFKNRSILRTEFPCLSQSATITPNSVGVDIVTNPTGSAADEVTVDEIDALPYLQFEPGETDAVLSDEELAFAKVSYTVPYDVPEDLRVYYWMASQTVFTSQGSDPFPVNNFDTDDILINGPGFEVIDFTATPNNGAPGSPITYTITVDNIRPDLDIDGLAVSSADLVFQSVCSEDPFPGTGSDWLDPLATPITVLGANTDPGSPNENRASCTFTSNIPGDVVTPTYQVEATITASGAGIDPSYDVSIDVKSDPVGIEQPSMDVSKRVSQVISGGQVVYSGLPGEVVPVVRPGDQITYEITLDNTGDLDLTHIWIVDSLTGVILVDPVDPNNYVLAAGNQTSVTTSCLVTSQSQDPLNNNVTVSADTVDLPVRSVDATASTSVDVVDSALEIDLVAYDAGTGLPIPDGGSVTPPINIEYELTLYNNGATDVTDLSYVQLGYPLETIGVADVSELPALPSSILAGGSVTLSPRWPYAILPGESDPLTSTIRVRGIIDGSNVLYGQDQFVIDLAVDGISLDVQVLEPTAGAVLRGGSVVYEITVVNTEPTSFLCGVSVSQYRRDPGNGNEELINSNVLMQWPSVTGQLGGVSLAERTATGVVSYLVTGADKDPLEMIFQVNAPYLCPTTPLDPILVDRRSVIVDISDAQVNASISFTDNLGGDGVAQVGEVAQFTYNAVNVSNVTLDELAATWQIVHIGTPQAFTTGPSPTIIGSFETTTGTFSYQIQPPDAVVDQFIVEVTLEGKDNLDNDVSITTARVVPISTDNVLLSGTGPASAVEGDVIEVEYSITNETGGELTSIVLENMLLPAGDREVANHASLADTATVEGSFLYRIEPGVGIENGVLVIPLRARGELEVGGTATVTASVEVKIRPILTLTKIGPQTVIAGGAATYTITITNNSDPDAPDIGDGMPPNQGVFFPSTGFTDAVFSDYGLEPLADHFVSWPADPRDGNSVTTGWLPPGTSVSGTFYIAEVLPDVSPLTNIFTATGAAEYDSRTVSASDEHTLEVGCPIGFTISVRNLESPITDIDNTLGEDLRWQVSLRNLSSGPISAMTVDEYLYYEGTVPSDHINWLSGTPGALGPGEVAVMMFGPNPGSLLDYFDTPITSEYVGQGDDFIVESVAVSFSDGSGPQACSSVLPYQLFSPIQLSKTADLQFAFYGETINYTLRLRNITEEDDDPYDYFTVTTYDSLVYDGVPAGPIEFDLGGGNWQSTFIMGPPDQATTSYPYDISRTLQYTPTESDGYVVENVARTEFPDAIDPTLTLYVLEEETVEVGTPLALTKVANVTEAAPGSTITYDYTITNLTDQTIFNIQAADDNPEIGNLIPDLTGGVISLQPGETFTGLVDVPYTVPLDSPDPIVNTFTVTGEIGGREFTQSITISVPLTPSEISIMKYLSPDGNPATVITGTDDFETLIELPSGTPVYYCFLIEYTGAPTTSVTDLVVNDTRYDPTTVEAALRAAVGVPSGPITIDGEEQIAFCLPDAFVLSQSLENPYSNTVILTGTGGAGQVYAEDTLSVVIKGTELILTKEPSPPLGFVGDVIEFTLRIENAAGSGPIMIDELTDEHLGGPINLADITGWSQGVEGLLEPGDVVFFTYTRPISESDPDPLVNIASVAGEYVYEDLPDNPGTYIRTGNLLYDTSRAVVAVTDSRLLVHKTASPNVVSPSPASCEVKDGVGDDPGLPACNMIQYSVTITHVGNKPEPVMTLTVEDEYIDPATGTLMTDTIVIDAFDPDDVDNYPSIAQGLEPFETLVVTYQLPAPTVAQLLASPVSLDPYLNTAIVTGQIADPLADPDVATSTESVDILAPNLRVVKSSQLGAASTGQDVPYDITIINIGDDTQTLNNINVRDFYIEPGTTTEVEFFDYSLNNCGATPDVDCPFIFVYGEEPYIDRDGEPSTLEPNPLAGTPYDFNRGLLSRERLEGVVTTTIPADWPNDEFTNTLQVQATYGAGTLVLDGASATVDIRAGGINVAKLASVTSGITGSPVTYTIQMSNVGTTDITQIVLYDEGMDGGPSVTLPNVTYPFPGGDDILQPGEEYEYEYTTTLPPVDNDLYINEVVATATTTDGVVVNRASAIVEVSGANIAVEKFVCVGTDGDGQAETMIDPCTQVVNLADGLPDDVTYYLHIYNPGALPLFDITVNDSLIGAITGVSWPYSDTPGDGLNAENPGDDDEVWYMYPYTVPPGAPDTLDNIVNVVGNPADGDPVRDSSFATLRFVSGDLLLVKTVNPTQAEVGDTVQYTLTVENIGGTAITEVQVIDPLLNGATPICANMTLDPGTGPQNCGAPINYTVTPADNSPLVNTATATGMQSGSQLTDTSSATLEIVQDGLVVTKTANPTVVDITAMDTSVDYTYLIRNTGTTTITISDILDTDPDFVHGLSLPIVLGPSGEISFTWTKPYILASDPDPYVNTVTVVGTGATGDVMAQATEMVYQASNGQLVVANTADVTFAQEGDTVTFTYLVSNIGGVALDQLNVSDNLCSPTSGNFVTNGTIAPGQTLTYYCQQTAALPGPIVSTLYAEANDSGTLLVDTATAQVDVIESGGALLVTKMADRTTASPGDTVNFTVEVTNVGAVQLTNFTVDDPMITLSPAPPATLDPNQSFQMTGSYTVPLTDPIPDSLSNTVTVTATDQSLTEFTDSASTSVAIVENSMAMLLLSKQASPQTALPGDTVTYAFTVRNVGNAALSGIEINDPMLTTNPMALPQTLTPGNVITVNVPIQIPADTVVPELVNTAEVTAPDTDLYPEPDDTASATVFVEVLSLNKTADDTDVAPGSTITYTFEITNNSTADVLNVVLTDPQIDTWVDPDLVGPTGGTVSASGVTITGTRRLAADFIPVGSLPTMLTNTASLTIAGTPAGEDTAIVTVDRSLLTFTKVANPTSAQPGAQIEYTFTIQNDTGAPIDMAEISDPVLGFPVIIPSGIITMGTNEFTGYGVLPVDQDPGTTFTNTATLSIDGVVYDTASADVLAGLPPTFDKSAPSVVARGTNLVFTFTIENPNDFPMSNVTITDSFIDATSGATWTTDPTDMTLGANETLVVTATYPVPITYPEPPDNFITNTAELEVGGSVVDTDEVTVEVVDATFLIFIDEVSQSGGDLDALNGDPLLTGQQTTLVYTMQNLDSVNEVTDLTYEFSFGFDPELNCQPVGDAPPTSLQPFDGLGNGGDDEVTVECIFTPPVGTTVYPNPSDLFKEVRVFAEGMADTEAVDFEALQPYELVDLALGIEFYVIGSTDPYPATGPGSLQFQFSIWNAGASSIGCTTGVGGVVDSDPCHLSVIVDDGDGNASTNLLNNQIQTLFGATIHDLVLAPYAAPLTFGGIGADYPAILQITVSTPPTTTYTIVVEGGHYSAAVADMLEYYDEIRASDTMPFVVLDVQITTTPAQWFLGDTVNYNVIVTNRSQFQVTGLNGTFQIVPTAVQNAPQSGIMLMSGSASPSEQVAGTLTFLVTTLAADGLPGSSTTAVVSKVEDLETDYLFIATVGGFALGSQVTGSGQVIIIRTNLAGEGTDPNATTPQVTKTASATSVQAGDPVIWTVTVRNGWTQPMTDIVITDSVPGDLTFTSATASVGTVTIDGSDITVNAGTVASGDSVTLTINTAVSTEAAAPSTIQNTACATYTNGIQECGSASVSVAPGVDSLPGTGIREMSSNRNGGDSFPAILGFLMVGALMLLMGAGTTSNRRMIIAMVFVVIVIAVIVAAVVVLATGGDDDAEPTKEAEVKPTDEPELPTAEPAVGVPPTSTPYVVPTPSGVRYLTIPRLGEQFQVPVPIVNVPITNRQWDVSGLGYYVGWLQGTTWMEPDWGNTVLAAHVQLGTNNPGPFWGLSELVAGDEIVVTEGDFEHRFRVVEISRVDPNDWSVTAPTDGPMLTLITCTSWDNAYGIFSERMVVRAIPFDEEVAPDVGASG